LDIHAGPHRGTPLVVILPPLEVPLEGIKARLELDLPPVVLGGLDLHHVRLRQKVPAVDERGDHVCGGQSLQALLTLPDQLDEFLDHVDHLVLDLLQLVREGHLWVVLFGVAVALLEGGQQVLDGLVVEEGLQVGAVWDTPSLHGHF